MNVIMSFPGLRGGRGSTNVAYVPVQGRCLLVSKNAVKTVQGIVVSMNPIPIPTP